MKGKKMDMKEIQSTAELMQKECAKAYAEGVRNTLEELREVYGEGIEETDIWSEYMNEEAK